MPSKRADEPADDQQDRLALPEHWQLCKLAAMVSNELPGPGPAGVTVNAWMRMELAQEIWRQARDSLPHLDAKLNEGRHRTEEIRKLIGALKVGRHRLPELPADWWEMENQIPIPRAKFIKAVVGIKKVPDQMAWWRAFMEDRLKRQQISRRDIFSLDGLDLVTVPEDYELKKGRLEGALEYQRENRISPLAEGLELAVAYRRWRLTMETEKKARATPYHLAECIQAAAKKDAD